MKQRQEYIINPGFYMFGSGLRRRGYGNNTIFGYCEVVIGQWFGAEDVYRVTYITFFSQNSNRSLWVVNGLQY